MKAHATAAPRGTADDPKDTVAWSRIGPQTCEVRIGAGCPVLNCSGSGVIGCDFNPLAFNFGYLRVGDARCASLTLTNNTSSFQNGVLYANRTDGTGGDAGVLRLDGVLLGGTGSIAYGLNAGQSRTFTLCWSAQVTLAPCESTLVVWKIKSNNPACSLADVEVRGIIVRGCNCSVTPTNLSFGNVVVGDTSPSQTINIRNETGIKGLTGRIRVVTGDFVAPDSYGCCPPGTCALFLNVPIAFRPTRLGPQTGKIVVENLVGCLGPGNGAICDTVTVAGTGVTAVLGR